MTKRKTIALLLLIVAVSLSIAFILKVEFPQGFGVYFKREYYQQFGPFAISVEFLFASYYLFKKHEKANFTLALFGFTAILDPIFNQIGLFTSIVPLYGTIILSICGIYCLWIAFANTFNLKPLSRVAAILSVILAVLIELFFNYI